MSGRVTGPEGQPVADALIEVWQTAPNQLYDVQDKDQPRGTCGQASAPMRQVPIGFRRSCPSAIRFRMTVPRVNCSRRWDGIRFAPRMSIS